MNTQIIVDAGSCHEGKLAQAKELIRVGASCGASAVKFQLFKNLTPNIELPYEWMPELVGYGRLLGVDVFASVWDKEGIDALVKAEARTIKLAYPQRHNKELLSAIPERLSKVIISGDIFTDWSEKVTTKLYCIPEYPVKYQVDFDILDRFDGFSDHTIGIRQSANALCYGIKFLEKHFCLTGNEACPDAKFAITPKELEALCTIASGY
jgi:N-acetylneuraminate synthase